ncbi:Holliday junction DNA helicase RuvB, N-terminal domain protein [Leptospira yanagawae serovar Saopaulo str. Sao Paulo = ATCC 700523]|uniref:Holliday junction DNA helicase RuvB, N-terminal domain protein n=1 Tax=Leptospira yanagawae serovar Saopaulo str. Sao Paulo = ATCC 700523 TaxID=1249483 RepID=A0A5E8HHA8_9LEPT|nr:AAA family ATPase [Leptospira yanagawae]EOQ90675.1 Holliday junction DNA helicase RuvB, N-terminal domain protein [Leptospira yanagawae serovar Saopaulo str. Sao Paulo = ATCC 700523]
MKKKTIFPILFFMSNSPSQLDFFKAKELFATELKQANYQFVQEKEETIFRFRQNSVGKDKILDSLGIVRNYIENFRIYNFEEGYLNLQSLGENLFEPQKNLSSRFRIRFSFKSDLKVECSKLGDFSTKEVQTTLHLFQFLTLEGGTTKDPRSILEPLGVEVYDPILEKAKGNELGFDSVFGYDAVKEQILESLVFPLRRPEPFLEITKLTRQKPTGNLPRAVLFEGEPGVGKTSMAKIVSHLCGVPMVYVPIESILSKYYGESSQNLAMVFDAAALFPKCMLFLDEIDSLATSRDDGLFEATRNLLSVLLRKLDGFAEKTGTITIGATNRKDDLDSALLSRFDRKIRFPLPNREERAKILEGYAKQLEQKERETLADLLSNASGRNLKDYCDYVERRWITKNWSQLEQLTAPPIQFYLDSFPDFGWKH